MNYCTHCAGLLTAKVPEDDNRLRLVCTKCGMPHYQNPKIVAGCLPVWEGRQVLLCKRARRVKREAIRAKKTLHLYAKSNGQPSFPFRESLICYQSPHSPAGLGKPNR